MACQYAVDSLSQMVQTRLVAPSEAVPDAAEEVAVEAAVELESLPPQAASAAAPATTALAFRNERREIFLMVFASWKSSFSFSRPAGRMSSMRPPHYLYYKTACPVSEWKIPQIVCHFCSFAQKPVKSLTQSCNYFIFCTKRIVLYRFFHYIYTKKSDKMPVRPKKAGRAGFRSYCLGPPHSA